MQSSHLESEWKPSTREDDYFSCKLESFSRDESIFEILTKYFTSNRLRYRIVLARDYHPIEEIDKWIIENVECEWNCGYEQKTSMQNEYSFSDLATATLFRLRF